MIGLNGQSETKKMELINGISTNKMDNLWYYINSVCV